MSFIKLQFKPGVNRDQTNYSNEGGWWECDKIRFRSGYPEKIGGWTKVTTNLFNGVCRQMWNWITSYNDNFLAIGTDTKVYIEAGGAFYDITPLRAVTPVIASPYTDNCISTVSGSNIVTVTLTTLNEALTGDFVTLSGIVGPVGGIPAATLNANYQVTVVSSLIFTFVSPVAATSTVAAGGGTAISISFEIHPGYTTTVAGYGWGTGTWGRNAWGSGANQPIYLQQRDWWFNNFDNDIVMNIRNGTMYWWQRGNSFDPTSALQTRAISMQDYATLQGYDPVHVPIKNMQVLVSQVDRHIIAFGTMPYGSTNLLDFDPMLIRWASQDSPAEWGPTAVNSAGFLRVSRGSRIVCAFPTRQETLVWTDTNLYTLQFLGTSDVFGLQEYGDNVSIMSPRSVATAANVTYWMGQDKFYAYTGRIETLPCTLRNHVFQNINIEQADQIICGTNEQWNEIWWFYPTATSTFNNAYVVYNHLEKIWYYGTIERSAWLDTPMRHYPQAAAPVVQDASPLYSNLFDHESGVDADGVAMSSYIQSNDFDLDDGEQFMLSRRLIPDIGFNGSTATSPEATFEIRPRNFPGSGYQSDPADEQYVIQTSIGQYTGQVFIRARARQMAIKVLSESLGVQWQLGAPRLDVRADGKR